MEDPGSLLGLLIKINTPQLTKFLSMRDNLPSLRELFSNDIF